MNGCGVGRRIVVPKYYAVKLQIGTRDFLCFVCKPPNIDKAGRRRRSRRWWILPDSPVMCDGHARCIGATKWGWCPGRPIPGAPDPSVRFRRRPVTEFITRSYPIPLSAAALQYDRWFGRPLCSRRTNRHELGLVSCAYMGNELDRRRRWRRMLILCLQLRAGFAAIRWGYCIGRRGNTARFMARVVTITWTCDRVCRRDDDIH